MASAAASITSNFGFVGWPPPTMSLAFVAPSHAFRLEREHRPFANVAINLLGHAYAPQR
jgi:hypothetical protein